MATPAQGQQLDAKQQGPDLRKGMLNVFQRCCGRGDRPVSCGSLAQQQGLALSHD